MFVSKIENYVLPSGWSKSYLPDFTNIVMGQSPTSDTYNKSGKGMPFYQGKTEFGVLYPTVVKYCTAPNKIALPGATLLSVRAPVGPTNLANETCCIGRGLSAIHPADKISPLFILYLLRSIESDLSKEGTGSTFSAINKQFIEELEFGLPPLAEQNRIVAKIEELFSELDKGIDNLKTAQAQLKVYRQALLKHAFEGKLTAQWRAANQDKLDTTEALQKRIQQARLQRYQQQLADWEGVGKPVGKPKAPKALPLLTSIELVEFPALPYGWTYIRLGSVIDDPTYGTSKKCDYEIDGTGVLRIPNVVSGRIDASDLKSAQFSDDEKITYKLNTGDILIIRSNGSISIVGRCALVSEKDLDYLYAGYLIRLRPNKSLVNPGYLLNTFTLHSIRKQIEQKAKSTSGVNNINTGEIQSLVIALCGIDEQKQIQMEVESRLSEVDQLHLTITTSLQQAEALRQSILKKAFSGQLVPQDSIDEPASLLLARIKAEKAKQSPETNPRKSQKV